MRLTEKIKENDYWDKMELNYGQQDSGRIIDKLGQLEDIEEELGIELITLFNALNNGIYYDDGSYSDDDRLYITGNEIYNYARDKWVSIKDYKKTWFLSKEELDEELDPGWCDVPFGD